MFNLIQLQDRLRGFSEDQLKQFLQRPDPNIPDFMVMAALDEKNDAKVQEAQMKAQNQPSVREEMLAVAGLPAMEAGQMASSMAPKSDVRTNTGGDEMMTMARLAEDMPMEDDMEEDEELDIVETPVRKASYGGLMNMAMPLRNNMVTDMRQRPDPNQRLMLENALQQRRGFRSGLDNLGRDISGRVQNRTQEEVQDFVGEVGNMAQERFDVNLSEPSMAQMQRREVTGGMFGGKGMPPMRMAMKEGGIASMQGGGRGMFTDPNFNPSMGLFPTRVRPRPAEAQGQGLLGSMGFDPNKFQRTDWDAQFGKYYNADGTLKDEFKQNVASAAMNTDDQPDSVRDAQRMMDINEIPERPKKDDEKKPPPGTDDPAPRGFLSDLTASLDKMREDQKEQMEKNQALGLMLEGINLYKDRGVPGEKAGEGLKFMGQQTQKVQDRLAQLQGLEAKIGIAGATLAQKDRAVEAAIQKATAKQGLSAKDALARYTALSTKIIELETDLNRDDLVLDETKKAALENSLAGLKRVKERLEGQALGLMGDNILDNEFLKELYEVTTPKKEDK